MGVTRHLARPRAWPFYGALWVIANVSGSRSTGSTEGEGLAEEKSFRSRSPYPDTATVSPSAVASRKIGHFRSPHVDCRAASFTTFERRTSTMDKAIMNTIIETASETRQEIQIFSVWRDRLQARWGDGVRLGLHRCAVMEGHDAYRYLQARIIYGSTEFTDTIIAKTIDRVQSEDFNIADLFCEIRILNDLLESRVLNFQALTGSGGDEKTRIREALDEFFTIIAHESSVIYESFTERGARGAVFLDVDGKITYANLNARTMLGESALLHESFAACLPGEDRLAFERALLAMRTDPCRLPLYMTIGRHDANGKRCKLGLEIAYLGAVPLRSAFYLTLMWCPEFAIQGNFACAKSRLEYEWLPETRFNRRYSDTNACGGQFESTLMPPDTKKF